MNDFCFFKEENGASKSWPLGLERVWSHSVVSNSWRPHGLRSLPGPQSMEFSRLEYWSGLPFPSSGDLPDPGIESRSPMLQADSLPSESPGKPVLMMLSIFSCTCWSSLCLLGKNVYWSSNWSSSQFFFWFWKMWLLSSCTFVPYQM